MISSLRHDRRTIEQQNKYCLRQSEMGIGDCAGLPEEDLQKAMDESLRRMERRKAASVVHAPHVPCAFASLVCLDSSSSHPAPPMKCLTVGIHQKNHTTCRVHNSQSSLKSSEYTNEWTTLDGGGGG